jgi:hypothetical protein
LQGHAGAERISHKVGLFDARVLQQSGNVVGHRFICDRTIDIGRPPVRL